jgi:NADPH:quinone reductase-like Zn-dependent oxidoreductase
MSPAPDFHSHPDRPATTPSPTAPETPRTSMRAVVRDAYGTADVLAVRDVALPVARAGEVLVRVHAAGIDRGAWHLMTGRPYLLRLAGFGVRRPKNPGLGTELSGTVETVGPGTTGFRVGDEVYGVGRSTFAQYAVAASATLSRKPTGISHMQAAAVPTSGVTALQAVRDHGRLQRGQSVLVIGASGGVGSFAVQIARALGGHVTGVASTAKLDFVRALGVEDVIDYSVSDITDQAHRYDLVLDIGGNRPLAALRRLLNPMGTLVFVGGEGGGHLTGGLGRQALAVAFSLFTAQRLETFWVAQATSADLDTLTEMIESGLVTPALDKAWPLADIAMGMRDLEHGSVRGKIVAIP